MDHKYDDDEAPAQPGCCYTGVTNTTCQVDYLRATLPPGPDVLEKLMALVDNRGGWSMAEGGVMGYSHTYRRGAIAIFHSPARNQVCLQLSGKGCRQIEREGIVTDWRAFLSRLLKAECSICRIDWALDDGGGLLDIREMVSAARAKHYRSRFQVVRSMEALRGSSGAAILCGSRKSMFYVRIYEKADKQRARRWVRVEVEAKDQQADVLAQEYIMHGAAAVQGDLLSRIAFCTPSGKDTNASRWPVAPWWKEFLGGAVPARVRVAQDNKTLDHYAHIIERQYGPYLTLLMESPQYGRLWLLKVIEAGRARTTDKHRRIASR